MPSTSRRDFCRTLSVAAALTTGRAAAPKKVTVAAHAWVYAAPLPGYDFTPVLDQIFSDLSWAGLDALELMDRTLRHNDAVDRIGELSRKYKLPVIGTSFDAPMWNREKHSEIVEDASLVIERLAKLGGHTFGISVGDAGRKKTAAELDAQAELVRKLMGICGRNGIVLNLHNHIYEVKDDEYDLRATLKRIPDAKLGPDLDWLTGAGVDPVGFIRRHARRLIYLHLRDRGPSGVWTEAMGEGVIDYPAIGRALRDIGYAGDVAIELAHPPGFKLTRPLRESWRISREYVRKTLGY
ncbi:MAG TPA: sugar phosphate isomerase/epimerase [Bryobacteraceae bacterium]|nr:sugar phosphate isomerase/epimerase [Bryobacteraceae bacterium]